jgi:acetyltransferase-like isoleucine patch superfamily enzyme
MIAMAAVVTRDVPAERLWLGAPARDVDRAPLPIVLQESA